jgi:hypothetical protein
MKQFLPVPTSFKSTLLVGVTLFTSLFTYAQSGSSVPELVFKNPALESGSNGADNAVYRFSSVANNVDALVTIAGRSSSRVTVANIDMTSTGHDKAFQPQVAYNGGDAPRNTSWWMDFDVRFVVEGTNTAVTVSKFDVTALDVDGDGRSLREMVGFYNANTYMVENNTQLSISNIVASILGLIIPGREFVAPTTNYSGIDVDATRVMTTLGYNNKSYFRLRTGGSTGSNSSSAADRMYSFWFRGFDYNAPVQSTLPIKLASFAAMLNGNKVDLKWSTSMEKNTSHFEVERSYDGTNYSSIGVVFAYGNSDETRQYSFTDNTISANHGTVYYRLRSVDIDTKSELSYVRMIRFGKLSSTLSLVAYPNPAQNSVCITVPANWQGKNIKYEFFSQNGQLMMSNSAGSASQTETIDISRLARGYYFVRVSCEGETAQQKLVKQ